VRVALSVTDDFCIGDRFTVLLDAAVRGYTSDSTGALTPERPTDEGVVTRSHVELSSLAAGSRSAILSSNDPRNSARTGRG